MNVQLKFAVLLTCIRSTRLIASAEPSPQNLNMIASFSVNETASPRIILADAEKMGKMEILPLKE